MNAVQEQVKELVKVELAAANEKFPPFHSMHEGWAVIMEELDELKTEVNMADASLTEAWEHIKSNNPLAENEVNWARSYAINAACEAIQVAAMCRKFMEMGKQNG